MAGKKSPATFKPPSQKEMRRLDAESIVRRQLTTGPKFEKAVKKVERGLTKLEKDIRPGKK